MLDMFEKAYHSVSTYSNFSSQLLIDVMCAYRVNSCTHVEMKFYTLLQTYMQGFDAESKRERKKERDKGENKKQLKYKVR